MAWHCVDRLRSNEITKSRGTAFASIFFGVSSSSVRLAAVAAVYFCPGELTTLIRGRVRRPAYPQIFRGDHGFDRAKCELCVDSDESIHEHYPVTVTANTLHCWCRAVCVPSARLIGKQSDASTSTVAMKNLNSMTSTSMVLP